MPSITSVVKQTPSSQQFFKGDVDGTTAYYFPLQTSFTFTTGTLPTGVQSVNGTNIYFDTYANIRAWIGNSGSATKIALANTDFFRDMGKELNVYYYQQVAPTRVNVPIHAVTLSKAQKITGVLTESTEGVGGSVTGATYSAGNIPNYDTTFVVTWTANPDTTTGIPLGVSRTGYY